MSFVRGSNFALSSSIFFFFVLVINVQALLCDGLELLTVKLLELLNRVLVYRIHHVKHFQAFFAQCLQEGRGRNGSDALSCNVVNIILSLLHAVPVLLEANLLVARLRSLVTHEF